MSSLLSSVMAAAEFWGDRRLEADEGVAITEMRGDCWLLFCGVIELEKNDWLEAFERRELLLWLLFRGSESLFLSGVFNADDVDLVASFRTISETPFTIPITLSGAFISVVWMFCTDEIIGVSNRPN